MNLAAQSTRALLDDALMGSRRPSIGSPDVGGLGEPCRRGTAALPHLPEASRAPVEAPCPALGESSVDIAYGVTARSARPIHRGRPRHAPNTPWLNRALALEFGVERWIERLSAVSDDAVTRQNDVLRQIVRRNRHTTFGQQHGFGTLSSFSDFTRRVPVMDDTQLLHWLRYRAEYDPRALTVAPRSWREAAASPLLRGEREIREARAELGRLQRLCPEALQGALLCTRQAEARACAAASRLLGAKLVLPEEFWDIRDGNVRELLLLRLTLARPELTCLAGADRAELAHWMHQIETHHRFLLKDLRQGGFFLAHHLPVALQARLAPALAAQPERARALARQRVLGGRLRPVDLWPRLALWITPPSAQLEAVIEHELPAGLRIYLRAFEADPLRRAISVPVEGGACQPLIDEHFYEFAERAAWDAGQRDTATTQQLREGREYYVIISNEYGLYRYFTGDVVSVTGWRQGLPLLRFCSPAPVSRTLLAEVKPGHSPAARLQRAGVSVTPAATDTDRAAAAHDHARQAA